MKAENKNFYSNRRIVFVYIFFAIFCSILIGRFVYLTIFTEVKSTNYTKPLVVDRGAIKDRNGEILAQTIEVCDVSVNLNELRKLDEPNYKQLTNVLSNTLNIEPGEIYSKLKSTENFYSLKKRVTNEERDKIEQLKKDGLLKGIDVNFKLSRSYPNGDFASHILGYVNFDEKAIMGVEKIYEDRLKQNLNSQEDGTLILNDLYLTIDKYIQHSIEKSANDTVLKHKPDKLIVIVLDAKTGEVLGLTNRPSFNPNFYNQYTENDRSNSATSYAYEPGSVFKIFSLSIALDSKTITPNTDLYCPGYYLISDSKTDPSRIKCWNNIAHGHIKPENIMINSCNVGACISTSKLSNDFFYSRIKDFGFGIKTGIDVTYETKGIINSPKYWSLRSKPTISIGQEILTTPIQIAAAATALSNEGKLLKPQLVKKIQANNSEVIFQSSPIVVNEIVSRQTAKNILSMMEQTTLKGTGKGANIEGVKISTKTGTAEIFDNNLKKYSTDQFVASTIAIFPTENPKFIVYGAAINPTGGFIFGSKVIAPMIKDIAEKLILYSGLHKSGDTIIYQEPVIYTANSKKIVIDKYVPNLIGTSKRDLIQIFNPKSNKNVKLLINGDGLVVSQSIAPGTEIDNKTTIEVYLE